MTPTHPSARALDLFALGNPNADVAAHVEACERCRVQVAASSPTAAAVPAWALSPPPGRVGWRWPALAAACAACVAVVLIGRTDSIRDDQVGTRPKGQPSFAVYVEHDGAVRLWDGRSPVSQGDRLQLKVAAVGFSHLVVGVAEGGAWSTAYSGPVSPTGETALPRSFRVAPDTSTLQLGLLLCDQPCPKEAIAAAALASPRDAHRWWTSLSLTRKDKP